MTTLQIALTKEEVKEQKVYAAKYLSLINLELAYGDLVNVENVEKYTKAYKIHMANAERGYVEI